MTTFISAPFGNYLKFKNAVSVTGTWTYKPRPGLFKQVVKTLRYTRNGWRNKIGLRNRGIEYGIQKTNFNEVNNVSGCLYDGPLVVGVYGFTNTEEFEILFSFFNK